jgi:UDP-N-acetylmuramate dehydrogenase
MFTKPGDTRLAGVIAEKLTARLLMTGKMTMELSGEMKLHESMSRHTSWRTGGPADRFYIPADLDDLAGFLSLQDPAEQIIWLGLGSNMLVRDQGIRGTVIAITGVLDQLSITPQRTLTAGAGVTNAKAARFAAHSGLTGTEFLASIPGTIGGALAMNAGAFGSDTWSLVCSVQIINSRGEIHTRRPEEFDTGYRKVSLPEGEWFTAAEFRLAEDTDGQAGKRIRKFLAQRLQTQPANDPTCGSVFKNPPGDYAARLIDACGLKGKTIGDARVSEKHANFIVNSGSASAADIEQLINHIQQVVAEKFNVLLEPEVRIVGE